MFANGCSGRNPMVLGDAEQDEQDEGVVRYRGVGSWGMLGAQKSFTDRFLLFVYATVVVSMFDFHRSDRGSNPGRDGKIS